MLIGIIRRDWSCTVPRSVRQARSAAVLLTMISTQCLHLQSRKVRRVHNHLNTESKLFLVYCWHSS